jgi:hypothetical protein
MKIDVLPEHVLCRSDSYLAEKEVQIKIKNVKREAHRAPIEGAERGAIAEPATHFRPLQAVQDGLILISLKQFNAATPIILVC